MTVVSFNGNLVQLPQGCIVRRDIDPQFAVIEFMKAHIYGTDYGYYCEGANFSSLAAACKSIREKQEAAHAG